MPYRELLSDQPQAVKRKWWGRLVCLVWPHDWLILKINVQKSINLAEYSPLAGKDAICRRCGKSWFDAGDPLFKPTTHIEQPGDRPQMATPAKHIQPAFEGSHRNHWPPPPTKGIVFKLE